MIFNRENFTGWLFILPAVLGVVLFRFWPALNAIIQSFYEFSLLSPQKFFTGLGNYRELLFGDPTFYKSLFVTFKYLIMRVPMEVGLALVLALALNQQKKIINVIRTIVFTPVVASMIVVSVLWTLMYHPMNGIINSLLTMMGLPAQEFLSSATQALPSLTVSIVWKRVGFSMVIIIAGLKQIPQHFYEAAKIDGANAFQQFRYITLPLLKGTLKYVTVMATIFSFQVLGPIYVMTQGGPIDSTRILIYYVYEQGFQNLRMGYANALSLVLLIVLAIISYFQIRILGEDVEY